jgi:hypothetical protein
MSAESVKTAVWRALFSTQPNGTYLTKHFLTYIRLKLFSISVRNRFGKPE